MADLPIAARVAPTLPEGFLSIGFRRTVARTVFAQSVEQPRGREQNVAFGRRQRRRHGFGQPPPLSARIGGEKIMSFAGDLEQNFAPVGYRRFAADKTARFELGENAGERLGLQPLGLCGGRSTDGMRK